MNGLIAWFASNRVAANLIMILILTAGVMAINDTQKEIFPNINLDLVTVTVPYPGANPTEVESGIINKVEEAIADIEGVSELEGLAREHFGLVNAKLSFDANPKETKDLIRSRVEGIAFPENAGKPVVTELTIKDVVANVVVSGEADERTLKRLAEKVRQDLLKDPRITQVDISNVKPYEISIEVSELSLQRYGLSFAELVAAIKRQSIDIPVGSISESTGKTSIIAEGEVNTRDGFEEIVVRSQPDGGRIYLSDVARIIDGFQQGRSQSEFNGEPAVFLSVHRVGKQNILDVSDALYAYVKNPTTSLPDGIHIGMWNDTSRYFRSRVDLLMANAAMGFALVFVLLMLFLRWRLSFWVSLGIPISFLGAIWILKVSGESINMVSMFGLILVLGIVVDDAIIVGESIFTHQKAGRTGLSGAISGTQEVASPVIFSVLTTIVMFGPLLFLPGPEGKLMYSVPFVVIATLTFSLFESIFMLPAHLSHYTHNPKPKGIFNAFQQLFENGLENFIRFIYQPFLNWVLRWRYAVAATFISMFMLSMALMAGGWLKVVMFSEIEADISVANVEFTKGGSPELAKNAVKQIEQAALTLKEQLRQETGEEQIGNILTMYGVDMDGQRGDNVGSVIMEMTPSEQREISGKSLNRRWRKLAGNIPDAVSLSYDSTFNKPGPAIDIELTDADPIVLKEAADKLKVKLSGYEGVYDVSDSTDHGQSEISLRMKPMAADLQLQLDSVATQVRQAFLGTEVQRVQRGGEEVKVLVGYPADERDSLWYLENMNVRLLDGTSIPLLTVADVHFGQGPSEIKHTNRMRTLRVFAYVDSSIADPSKIMKSVTESFLPTLGVRWSLAGLQKSADEFKGILLDGYVIALLVMYLLMAVLFKSYFQPLMVMFAIPFGLIGALLGHLMVGIDVTVWSLIGMCAVSGVVVNDNLVMVDYINRKRSENMPMIEAISTAGGARFRPIILTSITTFGGLVPLIAETSVQAQFLIPMAVSLGFGVMFATFVTLILVPAQYYMMDDARIIAQKYLPKHIFQDFSDGIDKQAPNNTAKESSGTIVEQMMQGASNLIQKTNDKNEELLWQGTSPIQPAVGLSTGDLELRSEPYTAIEENVFSPSQSQVDDHWNDSLEEAYARGYEMGLYGQLEAVSPYVAEEIGASWEAGYSDGLDAYELRRQL